MTLASDIRQGAAMLWHLQRIRRLVRQSGELGPYTRVTVAQIDCEDPECPGPATQITILGVDLMRRVLVVHRPVCQVSADDIGALFV